MAEPLDTRELVQIANAVHAVAKNISNFNALDKERILLAVAVLYGIVKPLEPRVRKPRPLKSAPRKRG